MSHRTSGGFSCFTIDALIGNSRGSPPPPPVSVTDEWSISSDYTSPTLQYVVSCSRLEDACRSSQPTAAATASKFADLARQESVDDVGGGSRHAFRVYRPASLDGAASSVRTSNGTQPQGGILATLQRQAMRFYSNDVDDYHWTTPTPCEIHTAGRRITDIISTRLSSTGHAHSNCKYIEI